MNAIQTLAALPWVGHLGWVLIHFFWQGVGIAAVYGLLRTRLSAPGPRYLLACGALTLMFGAPIATWTLTAPTLAPPFQASVTPDRTATIPASRPSLPLTALPSPVRASVLATPQTSLALLWIVAAWLLGASLLCLRLAGGWIFTGQLRARDVRPGPADWQATLRRLTARIGVTRPVRLLVSAAVQTPVVLGWLRPVILVPVGAFSGFSTAQLELLLTHELAHIRRNDYLVNLLQSVAEALLFYHPAVWWISGHIRQEREACCDDLALASGGDVLDYAQALVELESHRTPAGIALAASGGSLKNRIARLLGESPAQRSSGPGAAMMMSVVLLVAAYGFAQSDAKRAFDVASIKRNSSGVLYHRLRALPGGHLSGENATVMMVIQNAYSVQMYQVVGGPDWINSEGYDIDAKPETPVERDKVWLMAQTLLADRFHLTLHRDTRELPVFVLSVTKSGVKSQPPKAGSVPCAPAGTNTPGPMPGPIPCGMIRVSMGPQGVQLTGSKVPMPEFVRILAGVMGRPVIDKTGYTGEIEVHVNFLPDESTLGMPRGNGPMGGPPPDNAADSNIPSIFAAVQEQVGVKLDSSKGPVEVLVIDRVERPTAN